MIADLYGNQRSAICDLRSDLRSAIRDHMENSLKPCVTRMILSHEAWNTRQEKKRQAQTELKTNSKYREIII